MCNCGNKIKFSGKITSFVIAAATIACDLKSLTLWRIQHTKGWKLLVKTASSIFSFLIFWSQQSINLQVSWHNIHFGFSLILWARQAVFLRQYLISWIATSVSLFIVSNSLLLIVSIFMDHIIMSNEQITLHQASMFWNSYFNKVQVHAKVYNTCCYFKWQMEELFLAKSYFKDATG